jgi:hypothetical protein
MKKVLYLLIFIPATVFSQNNPANLVKLPVYPSFREMATKFFHSYTLPNVEYDKRYSFAKKPDGWHILLTDLMKDKVLQDDLFWNRSSNTYTSLSYQITEKPISVPKNYDNWENNYFNTISPYFGYKEWDADVIKEYGVLPNLSDSVMNALARAYCKYALGLLDHYLGIPNPNLTFKKPRTLNSLNAEQLENYRKFEHLAIETYKKLWKLNPKFENFVSDVYTVYSNEIMNSFLTLRYYQNEEEAQKELKQELYDPFYRCIARNYLASCDSNAIIFTNGDNDTYPLLYVQEKEGFRKDVLVVNVSLLGSPQYLNHLFNKIGTSDPLSLYIEKSQYTNGSLAYAYILKRKGDEDPMELRDLMGFIASSDTATKFKNDGEYLTYIPTTHFKLTVNKGNAIKNKIVSIKDTDEIVTTMDWHIKETSALYQNDIAILDILASTDFKRPIYYAVTVGDESYLNLDRYFQLEGMAYKIVPIISESNENYQNGRINTTILYNKLKNLFCNLNWQSGNIDVPSDHKLMASNYRTQYSRLADALINENKPDSAREILSLCFSKFPINVIPANYWILPHIRCYYKLNEIEKANELVNIVVEKYYRELVQLSKNYMHLSEEDDQTVRISLYALSELIKLTDQFEQKKLHKAIKSKFDKYYGHFNLL